jgi:hypothetical protein
MGVLQAFGTLLGLKEGNQRTLHHPFCNFKEEKLTVNKGMHQDFWISNIKTNEGITMQHLTEFAELWTRVSEVHLVEGTADDIT